MNVVNKFNDKHSIFFFISLKYFKLIFTLFFLVSHDFHFSPEKYLQHIPSHNTLFLLIGISLNPAKFMRHARFSEIIFKIIGLF